MSPFSKPMAFLSIEAMGFDPMASFFWFQVVAADKRIRRNAKMTSRNHQPIELSPHLFQVGTPSFPAYLSRGEEGMLLEGGTGATFGIIIDQLKFLGIAPEAIKYIVLTHTHADHIGAIPHFQRAWPHIKLLRAPSGSRPWRGPSCSSSSCSSTSALPSSSKPNRRSTLCLTL